MANIAVSDKTHDEIRDMAYDNKTNMKDLAEKMWQFANMRREEFAREMF